MPRLLDKVAIINGSSSGLGRAIALDLQHRGPVLSFVQFSTPPHNLKFPKMLQTLLMSSF